MKLSGTQITNGLLNKKKTFATSTLFSGRQSKEAALLHYSKTKNFTLQGFLFLSPNDTKYPEV